jgi:general L-amino acid transport system permease protein
MPRRSADGVARGAFSSPRLRAYLWQALALVAVVWFGAAVAGNVITNLESRGIASGFGFLSRRAGFDVTMTLIPFSQASSFGRAFLVGLLNTLLVSALGVVFATLLGFIVGIARLSPNWLMAKLAASYVEVLRNIPLLLQLFFWYFAVLRALPAPRGSIEIAGIAFLNNRGLYLPSPIASAGTGAALILLAVAVVLLLGVLVLRGGSPVVLRRARLGIGALVGLALLWLIASVGWNTPHLAGFNFQGGVALIPEFVALVVALSTYTASFIAEVVRGGLQSVPRGQIEAASALGLSRLRTLRLVVIPQALRVIFPPLTNQYLNLTKNSSLATAIAYPDLVSVFGGTVLNITGQALEVIAITMGVYLVISLAIALGMNRYNRAVALRGA